MEKPNIALPIFRITVRNLLIRILFPVLVGNPRCVQKHRLESSCTQRRVSYGI